MSKNYKDESYKQSFKPVVKINKIQQLQKVNPNLRYAGVRIDDNFDPDGTVLQEYLDRGWEIVIDDQNIVNDYDSTKTTEDNYKPVPLVKTGKGGARFVYVSIDKEKWRANQLADKDKRDKVLNSSAGGRVVKRSGQTISITDENASSDQKYD